MTQATTTYTLKATQKGTQKGAPKFHYQVINDQTGAIVSTRTSTREYAACTIDGSFYFGRLDLIGKGDHGRQILFAQGYGHNNGKMQAGMFEGHPERLQTLQTIAYRYKATK